MKKIYLVLSMGLGLAFTNTAIAQPASVVLIPDVGTSLVFPSITSAYAAIPASPTMSYIIELLPNYAGTDASEVYPIQLTDKGIPANSPNTITIRPAAGNNGETIQRPTPDFNPVIQFNGGDNIILDGRPGGIASSPANYLTVNQAYSTTVALPTGSTFRNIELLNSANYNTIQFINALAAQATSITGAQNIVIGGTSTSSFNKILNNIVTGGSRGIQDFGGTAPTTNLNNTVHYNTVRNNSGIAIFAGTQQNGSYVGNTVEISGATLLGASLEGIRNQASGGTTTIAFNTINIATTSTTITTLQGIIDLAGASTENIIGNSIVSLSAPSATSITGLNISIATANPGNVFNISQNRISGLSSTAAVNARGMSLFPNTGGVLNVNNNFVALTSDNSAAVAIFGILFGLRAGSAYTSNVYYNSVNIAGATTATAINAYGIYRSDNEAGSVYNQRNNIATMNRNAGIAFFNSNANGTLDIDYNNYSGLGAINSSYAAAWNSTTVFYDNTQLAAYKAAATPNEQNTTFVPVTYVSPTDLHLAGASVADANLKAIPVSGITVDIDNNTRSTTAPTKGADEPGGPVPVSLFVFSGVSKGSFNQLSWSTASESNNSGFELQRSTDGQVFNALGFVPSESDNGNSAVTLSYSFDDKKPFTAGSYYRLKQVDKDGRFTYSNIISIKGKGVMGIEITNLYPNPVKDVFNVIMGSEKVGTVTILVTDVSGKTVVNKTVAVNAGDNIIPMQSSALNAGIYMLRVVHQQTKETATIQFIK